MRAIEKATAHYSNLARRKIPVPEWGIDVYALPHTPADLARIRAICDGDNDKWWAACLVVLAQDEEGTPLFGFGDLNDLMTKADGDTVLAVGAKIMQKATPEEHAGNS